MNISITPEQVALIAAAVIGSVGAKHGWAAGQKLPSVLPENLTGDANLKDVRFTQDSVPNVFKNAQNPSQQLMD
jgi:hypothetical protein